MTGLCVYGPVVSNTRVSLADPLSTVGYNVGPPWIIIFHTFPMDAQSEFGGHIYKLSSFITFL